MKCDNENDNYNFSMIMPVIPICHYHCAVILPSDLLPVQYYLIF